MKVAVIPARGGSKRIPRKNIRPFCGKPMLVWSIDVARESACFDDVIVSTDDPEIADIAVRHGASVPFMRPETLSGDHAGTIPVIQHAVQWFQEQGQRQLEAVCCIYATAPFLQAADLVRGFEALHANDCSYTFSVTTYPFPIQRAIRLTAAGRVEMFQPDQFQTRSQDLEEAWHDAGQFYWGRPQAWLRGEVVFSPASIPIPIPRHRVQDIDTPEDWLRAEWMFRAMLAGTDSS